MNLITNKIFLISTGLFLVVAIGAIWILYPPAIKQYRENKSLQTQLAADVSTNSQHNQSVKELAANQTVVSNLYDLANQALPTDPQADLLLLQLDGLTSSLGLNASITVPFGGGGTTSSSTTTPAKTDDDVKATGSTGASATPVVTTAPVTKTEFTISGEFSFAQVRTLLSRLRSFIRWNSVTGIDISNSGEKFTSTISGQVFWSAAPSRDFSGSSTVILDNAKKLFEGFQSYTTVPDITKEGRFGKSDPFGS